MLCCNSNANMIAEVCTAEYLTFGRFLTRAVPAGGGGGGCKHPSLSFLANGGKKSTRIARRRFMPTCSDILSAYILETSVPGHLRSGDQARPTSKKFVIVTWLQFWEALLN